MLFSWDAPCCPSGVESSQAQTERFTVEGSSGSIPEPVWSPWPGLSGAQASPQGVPGGQRSRHSNLPNPVFLTLVMNKAVCKVVLNYEFRFMSIFAIERSDF